MMSPDPQAPKPIPSPVKAVIKWKDPDFPSKLTKWGVFHEYFTADISINHKTGSGTIQLRKP